jgi:hypothetical protein
VAKTDFRVSSPSYFVVFVFGFDFGRGKGRELGKTYGAFCPFICQIVDLNWITALLSTTRSIVTMISVASGNAWLIWITLAPAFTHAFVVTPILCEILVAWIWADWRGRRVDFKGVDTAAGI